MLRRVTPTSVAIFVATSSACTVEILLGRADGTDLTVHTSSPQPTRALGSRLHVVVCEITFPESRPLIPEVVYAYDIRMTPTAPAGPSRRLVDQPGLLTGSVPLGYKAGQSPTFSLPPGLDYLHIVHGSCRKPHGGGRDALVIVDRLIAAAHDKQGITNTTQDARQRPHHLLLTGDQIYADDVAVVLLPMLIAAGDLLLEEVVKERYDAVEMMSDVVKPGWSRQAYLKVNSKLSSDHSENHLMYFAEFCAMYVLCWSDELWPRNANGEPTAASLDLDRAYDPTIYRAYPTAGYGAKEARDALEKVNEARRNAQKQRAEVLGFASTVRRIRRVLANVPTLMMFDDHEVSDDWNLDKSWKAASRSDPALHQIVRNGLLSAAVFQAWGNLPSRFTAGVGEAVLDVVTVPVGQLSSDVSVNPAAADILLDIAPGPVSLPAQRINWDWTIDGPGHRIIALDTRTHRDYDTALGGKYAALLTPSEVQRQLTDHRPMDGRLCFVIAPAPVIGHPLLEEVLQPGMARAKGARAADNEAWCVNRPGFESFMRQLASFRQVVLLSGDVHYAYTNHTAYFGGNSQPPARIVQLCSSATKNSDSMTRAIEVAGFLKMTGRGWFGLSMPINDEVGARLRRNLEGGAWFAETRILRQLYFDFLLSERLSPPPVIPDGPWFSAEALADVEGIIVPSRADDWSYQVRYLGDERHAVKRLADALLTWPSLTPSIITDFVACSGVTVVGEPNVGQVTFPVVNGQMKLLHRIHWLGVGVQPTDAVSTFTEHIVPLAPPIDAERPKAYK